MRNEIDYRLFRLVNFVIALLIVYGTNGVAFAEDRRNYGPTPSAEGAAVHFIDLKDGQTVPPKVTIRFGLREMGVAPAGSDRANSGHHHLLIDTELPPLDQPIPNDFNHLHFGAGQTEAEVTLKPGTHTLQLLLGDKDHIPHNPPVMSPRISVVVTGDNAAPKEAAAPRPTRRTQVTPDDLALTEGFRSTDVSKVPRRDIAALPAEFSRQDFHCPFARTEE